MFRFPRHIYVALAVATPLSGLAACDDVLVGDGDADERQEELDTHRTLWQQAGLGHYYVRQRVICFCPAEVVRPVEVEVLDGAIVSVTDVETQEPVAPERWTSYRTVDQLFELLQDAIDEQAHSIEVEYHTALGYPVDFFIDYNPMLADEEIGYQITQLTSMQ